MSVLKPTLLFMGFIDQSTEMLHANVVTDQHIPKELECEDVEVHRAGTTEGLSAAMRDVVELLDAANKRIGRLCDLVSDAAQLMDNEVGMSSEDMPAMKSLIARCYQELDGGRS